MARRVALWIVLQAIGLRPTVAEMQPADVLVIVNQSSATSVAIGADYCARWQIPPEQVCRLPIGTPTDEWISRELFNTEVREPIARHVRSLFSSGHLIEALVLTQGVPLAVRNTAGVGRNQNAASVDSELTQLFTGRVGSEGHAGALSNPVFGRYEPFSVHEYAELSFLVFRLMGNEPPDPATHIPPDLRRMLDATVHPPLARRVVLRPSHPDRAPPGLVAEAESLLASVGLDGTEAEASAGEATLDWSWSTDIAIDAGDSDELGVLLGGSVPPERPEAPARTQGSRAPDAAGLTFGDRVVFPVGAEHLVRPAMLLDRYLRGVPLGLAYYESLPSLSWAHVILCDPLHRSPVVYTIPPTLLALEPERVRHGTEVLGARVYGEGFTHETDMEVQIDGTPCRNLRLASEKMLTCELPALDPGVHELTVRSFQGRSAASLQVVAYPAIRLDGELEVDRRATLEIHGQKGERYQLLLGVAAIEHPIGPFGDLRLDPSRGLHVLRTGLLAEDVVYLHGKVHSDPELSGTRFYLQCAVGNAAGRWASFTNFIEIVHP